LLFIASSFAAAIWVTVIHFGTLAACLKYGGFHALAVGKLRAIVKETGAVSTDYESPEDVDTLCDRTTPYAKNWQPTADALWKAQCETCAHHNDCK